MALVHTRNHLAGSHNQTQRIEIYVLRINLDFNK